MWEVLCNRMRLPTGKTELEEKNMGYETKLYVVDKSDHIEQNGLRWGDTIAVFDLCKSYPVSDKMRHYPPADCYVYADDGNTMITEDCYGEPLREIPLKDTIQIIQEATEQDGYYRRYAPLLGLLKGFKEEDWDKLVVLHYGY